MKTLLIALIAVLLLTSTVALAVAQDEVITSGTNGSITVTAEESGVTDAEVADVTLPENETGGIGPENPLWGLDRALERIQLALALNKSEKARMGLAHARERLLEVRARIQAKRLDQAEKALQNRERILEEAKARINEIELENATEEAETEAELEKELEEQDNEADDVETEIEIEDANLTETQRTELLQVRDRLKNQTQDLKQAMEAKRDRTKIKLKASLNKTDAEVEQMLENIANETGLEKAKETRARAMVKRAEVFAKIAEKRIEKAEAMGADITALKEALENAKAMISQANSSADPKEIREIAQEAKEVARAIKRENAIQVIAKVIAKLEEKQGEGSNVSNAISKLTAVQTKLEAKRGAEVNATNKTA
ncbi:hypothetical protein COS75_02545 [Candidatus Pacearchaeota archaeon CG06_land_8_20_14_3_00_35_12]|nr:MAG: hypothetical protein COS75_02545 [Candidatus Pacearchaeota archaeon CG06_land_8_20_14_3_00_35_12]